MLLFSNVDTIPELLKQIDALPEETSSAPKEVVAEAKTVAKLLLNGVKMNGAHVNLRANVIAENFRQIECQVAGREIKPKVAPGTAPAAPAAVQTPEA